jgi:hypothetical protein
VESDEIKRRKLRRGIKRWGKRGGRTQINSVVESSRWLGAENGEQMAKFQIL